MHESQLDWWIDYTMGSEEPFDKAFESLPTIKECRKREIIEENEDNIFPF